MLVKDLLFIGVLTQNIIIFNQYNDEIYDGKIIDFEKNEYADKIKEAEVTKWYTHPTNLNYVFIECKEAE